MDESDFTAIGEGAEMIETVSIGFGEGDFGGGPFGGNISYVVGPATTEWTEYSES